MTNRCVESRFSALIIVRLPSLGRCPRLGMTVAPLALHPLVFTTLCEAIVGRPPPRTPFAVGVSQKRPTTQCRPQGRCYSFNLQPLHLSFRRAEHRHFLIYRRPD